jgi:hypothetical protein
MSQALTWMSTRRGQEAALLECSTGLAVTETASPANIRRKGIAVIHGIGSAHESDTLLDIGQPFLEWVRRWLEIQDRQAAFQDGLLAFSRTDDGRAEPIPHARLELAGAPDCPAATWIMAEAWWSHSVRQPGFPVMVRWTIGHYARVVRQWVHVLVLRTERFARKRPGTSDPGFLARAVDALNTLALIPMFLVIGSIGFLGLVLLYAAAQVPVKPIQDFIVVRVLRNILVVNVAQFRAFLEDEVQAANMRRKLINALTFLAVDCDCEDLYVIAHSGGVPVAVDLLCHPEGCEAVARVRKIFTLGEGLNKAWTLDPRNRRLRGPFPPDVGWVDFWTAYDPVPGGELNPPRPLGVELPPSFVNEEVTHRMDVLSDHGGFWKNDEQVLWRVAQEIDAAPYQNSQFWAGNSVRIDRVRSMRWRVALLVALRMEASSTYLVALIAVWPQLNHIGKAWWTLASAVPGVSGLTKPIDHLVWLFGQDFANLAEGWGFLIFGPLVVAVPFFVLFRFLTQPIWDRWDRRERELSNYAAAFSRIDASGFQPRKTHRRSYLLALAGCAALPLAAVAEIGGTDAIRPALAFVLLLIAAVLVLYVIGLLAHFVRRRVPI